MTDAPAESSGLRNLLIAATVVGVLALWVSAIPLTMSPMIFDSGESNEAWAWFIAIWSMPVVIIAGLVAGWVGFVRRNRTVAIAGMVISAIPIVLAIGFLLQAGL